jgi:hypothetical protein
VRSRLWSVEGGRGGSSGKKELCRRIGISDATFYYWKAKYGRLEVNARRGGSWKRRTDG